MKISLRANARFAKRGRAIAIVSGGLDSVTLAHLLAHQGRELHLLAFDYGQRHKKELQFAQFCAQRLNVPLEIAELGGLGRLLGGSALTDETIAVPHGHYAAENMAITVVPNRNAIMLSVAYGMAVAREANLVAAGFHAGDHTIYPDCRPEFTRKFDKMQRAAVEGFGNPNLRLYTPFLRASKAAIVELGARLGVPFEETWSCYEGGEIHCGKCGTCRERIEAFELARVNDPTTYAN